MAAHEPFFASERAAASVTGCSAAMSAREAAVLAISLSANNVGTGVGAGISHVGIVPTAALTAVAGLAAICCGHRLGRRTWLPTSRRGLGVAAGLIFVLVGVYELFV